MVPPAATQLIVHRKLPIFNKTQQAVIYAIRKIVIGVRSLKYRTKRESSP